MISNTFYYFFLCLFFLYQLSQTQESFGNKTDLESLMAIKDKIEGLNAWNQSFHFCQWEGIICGKRHQRVLALNISGQSLIGSVSPSIGNLSFLRYVNLENNRFHGEIPQEVGQLSHLQKLLVHNNTFVGEIPVNLTQCTDLRWIDIRENNLTGIIPPGLGNLPSLVALRLSKNGLTGGIPDSLGNLSALEYLDFGWNSLVGSIPDALGGLSKVRDFIVQFNSFLSGQVPHSIYNISSLTKFAIGGNQFSGDLPPDMGLTLPNLEVFLVTGNQNLSGPIPVSLANASMIQQFDIASSGFSGSVPNNLGLLPNLYWLSLQHNSLGKGEPNDLSFLASLSNCSNLDILSISYNNFGGVFPISMTNFSGPMTILYLGHNPISGTIPEGIGSLVNLIALGIEHTSLQGNIPASIGNIQTLQHLYLFNNELGGIIPSSLANITNLSHLVLSGNRLHGSIPSSFGGYQYLQVLEVSQNNLNGSIPLELFNISTLSILLKLSQNHFTGSLPAETGNLNNLVELDVSGNKLSGEIPSTLSKCSRMEILRMQHNSFQGTFPQSLKSLRVIRYIDVSSNNLSGQIPKYLEDLPYLEELYMSNNKLEGKVPKKRCFSKCKCYFSGRKSQSLWWYPRNAVESMSNRWFQEKGKVCCFQMKGPLRVSYGQLFLATDGFSPENFLGLGGFGRVYKGKLDNEEKIVAVKVFDLHQKGASKSFIAECESLRGIRHRNLVKIVTSCSSTDYEGNDFKAMVFEFMSKGSLDDWLHPDVNGEEDQPRSLNLVERLNVATDVAIALNYLHHECYTTIIHRDLKPSNVLLDDDMVAHVGDFGLAKLLWGPTENLSETPTVSMGIKGSVGYAAPEYGMGVGASTEGDTYSYGILLLELFTGRRPTDEMFVDGLNMHNYASQALTNTVRHIADPVLISAEEEIGTIEECIASVIKIGVACSAPSPSERMDMEEVAKDLQSTRDRFLASIERNNKRA